MEQGQNPQQSNPQVPPQHVVTPVRSSQFTAVGAMWLRKPTNLAIAILAFLVIALALFLGYRMMFQSPDQVVSSFVKASQSRKAVNTSIFFDKQAEQAFAIVYKIPPKSFRVQKTTIVDKTATVELSWVAIDSNNGYRERKDTVVFQLRRDGSRWKLDRISQGSAVNFDFLFGN